MKHILVVALIGTLAAFPAGIRAQGGKTYKARLSPVPIAAYTPTVVGTGSVTATLNGMKLGITGTFEGLASSATVARINKSDKPGMRGTPLFDLAVSGGTNGTISGQIDLNAAQAQELAQGRYYVQLNSEKAAEGNLWGWLLSQEKK